MDRPTASLARRFVNAYSIFAQGVDKLQSIFALALRLYLADVFFRSGWIKLQSWDSTSALFNYEYHVPVLSPPVAAVMGTACELGLPVLIVLGLGSRLAAVALFVFNIVAATSYPDLSDAGRKDHVLWGTLMVVLFIYGPGKIALDAWLERKFGR